MLKSALERTKEWQIKSQDIEDSTLSLGHVEQLSSYLDLLILWSRKVDLVALADREELINRHLVDSYAAYLLIKSRISGDIGSCLDVGSGAGLPGLVFAILEPSSKFYLCEPREKRQIFLKETISALGIANAFVVGERLEGLGSAASRGGLTSFDLICSRALGMEDAFGKHSRLLLASGGRICQLLGPSWERGDREEPTSILNYSLFASGPERKLVFWE